MGLMSRTATTALLWLSLCAAMLAVALAAADSSPTSSLPEVLQSLGATGAAPFPCSFKAPDGKYFDFSSMTTPSGTQVPGFSPSEIYMINVCGAASTIDRQTERRDRPRRYSRGDGAVAVR